MVTRPSPDDVTSPEQLDEAMWGVRSRVLVIWEGRSRVYWIGPDEEITIGRLAKSTLCIDHHAVSRKHAVVRGGDPPTIEDSGSSNGVRVAGQRIPRGERIPLAQGELVELGPATLVVQRRPSPESPRRLSPALEALEALLPTVARSELSVLFLGETGTGKNRAAQRLHEMSARAARPFVHVSCAALPEALLEAELFGYERGAFTGAATAKPGLFEAAHGGTLFLDEIGELAVSTQSKLLAALESRTILRLGSVKPRPVDVRIVAATNRAIEEMIAQGAFRQDLYFRLDGITLNLPPLRERRDEILSLARAFLAPAAARAGRRGLELGGSAERALLAHPWPGNVRELRTVIERAAVLAATERVEAADLRLPPPGSGQAPGVGLRGELEGVERERIVATLEECSGNQTQAAKRLGISRRALIHRIEHFGLARPRKR